MNSPQPHQKARKCEHEIKGRPKEIAAFVLAVQGWNEDKSKIVKF